MLINTKHFGEIDLDDSKILYFERGVMGFENFRQFTLLFNNEEEGRPIISWLQCVDEPALALPVINPFAVKEDYNPEVEDEILNLIGGISEENAVVLVTLTIPSDIKNMTANIKAPIIINSDTRRGCQIIAENPDYEIKYHFYDKLLALKAEKGDM